MQCFATCANRAGSGHGCGRAVRAAHAAVAAVGGSRQHRLLVVATPRGEGRLREYREVINVVRNAGVEGGRLIYAACHDETLPVEDTLRVMLLTG